MIKHDFCKLTEMEKLLQIKILIKYFCLFSENMTEIQAILLFKCARNISKIIIKQPCQQGAHEYVNMLKPIYDYYM